MRLTRRHRMLAIGDSVLSGAEQELHRLRGWRVIVDARNCRQVARRVDGCGEKDIPSAIDALHTGLRRVRPDVVVVHLGHNGRLTGDHFDTFMTHAFDVPSVLWLTLREPREWEMSNNDVIRAGVARWSDAYLLDWHRISEGKPWFRSDRIHLTDLGAKALTTLVAMHCGSTV